MIVAAGSEDKVNLALSRAGSSGCGFSYEGCDGSEFRKRLKEQAGTGNIH